MEYGNKLVSFPYIDTVDRPKEKQALGQKVAKLAENGQVIGAGAGSSVLVAMECLAERVKAEGLSVSVICGAYETRLTAARLGLTVVSLLEAKPDWCFDGADEVDPEGNVLKGRGGALFQEKLIISSCAKRYLLADPSKQVEKLGRRFPVPVETYPEALSLVAEKLAELGASSISVRPAAGKDGPVLTEGGNLLLDCRFAVMDPTLERNIKAIPGVIESGLFQGYNFIRL
jgi:ribose 5-phosphate isomerase A